ncbi:MAG: c-type cytochrome [Sulfuricaulis sp.]
MKRIGSVVAMAVLLIGGCGKNAPPAPSATGSVPAPQANESFPAASLSRGARLYQENCAECHGPEAQGHPDWRNPQVVAAPPLDGSGNAWKRKKQDLIAVIKNGASRQGVPAMPAWQGRLSDQDIEDIMTWFQSLWPADVYARWRQDNAAGVAPKG